MQHLFLLLLTAGVLLANDGLRTFLEAYKSNDIPVACESGRHLFHSGMRDEKLLIAIGEVCSKADYIDFVGVLQQRLGQSPESRNAAVYFSTLVLQKRLLRQYMHEETDLSHYTLPVTDHILSRVYEAIKKKAFILVADNPKHLHIGDNNNYIDLYVQEQMHADEYSNGIKIQTHRYR